MNYEEIKLKWLKLSEKTRFVIVGCSGVALGWLIYTLIYIYNPIETYKATSSWTLAYFLAVIRQHGLHYWLTFTESDKRYFKSLIGAYWAYSFGMVLSIIINYILNEVLEVYHHISWLLSVTSVVLINYILLKRFAFGGNN